MSRRRPAPLPPRVPAPDDRPREATVFHTRLLKCTLAVAEARAYWAAAGAAPARPTVAQAFADYWFGARSYARVETLLDTLHGRFAAFPPALAVLHQWPHMTADTRRVICHWHVQLADPLYRAFTGDFVARRRAAARPELGREPVVAFVAAVGPPRWALPTRVELASKLLSTAHAAGLVGATRDPRPLTVPPVPAAALEYGLYLLRGIQFAGSLTDNPYFASLGLVGAALDERLRALPSLAFRRQGPLVDFGWRYPDLAAWAAATREPRRADGVGQPL